MLSKSYKITKFKNCYPSILVLITKILLVAASVEINLAQHTQSFPQHAERFSDCLFKV